MTTHAPSKDAHSTAAPHASSSVRIVPVTAAAVPALAQLGFSAFNAGAAAVGQPLEFPVVDIYVHILQDSLGKEHIFHAMAVREAGEDTKGGELYVEGVGEVLGSVVMNCSGEAAGLGPISVAAKAQQAGIGRKLMHACLEEVDRRGLSSVRLVNIAANPRAFTLYHSLGFRAAEYMMQCRGVIEAKHAPTLTADMQRDGITVRPMTAADIPHCERLHLATTSFSRIAAIRHAFHAQPAEQIATKAPHDGDAHSNGGSGPPHTAFVAVDARGEVVGYCDGPSTTNHWVAVSEAVLVYLYWRVGLAMGEKGAEGMMVLFVLTRQHGEMLERLVKLGVQPVRQTCLMVRGAYVQPHRFVYCPSVLW